MENYYQFLNYSPAHLISRMNEEARESKNYYTSPAGVLRCDVSPYLRSELAKIITIPFADCGFLKTLPGATYPVHVDAFRISAINMPMFGEDWGFESGFEVDGVMKPTGYKLNHFTLLNVMQRHGVSNKNPAKARVVLSIGFKEHTYDAMKELFHSGSLLNVTV